MCCVYVLKSLKDGRLYIGSTRMDVEERLKVHNRGSVRSTKGRRPFELVYFEKVEDYSEARQREIFFKSGRGRRYLFNLIKWAGSRVDKGDRL